MTVSFPSPTPSNPEMSSSDRIPLVVDVDGTLIKSDLLHETAFQFVARQPFLFWKLLLWLVLEGKAGLKARLAPFGTTVTATIPFRQEIIAEISKARSADRSVFLASASDHSLITEIAARVDGVTGVFATNSRTNLAGQAKADRLVAEFGLRGFDYIGDSAVDFPVWRAARSTFAVSHSGRLEQKIGREFPDMNFVARPRVSVRSVFKALRPHQWAKNTLVFIGLVAGHHFNAHSILAATVAFLCFSMAASSAYVMNDLLDLPGDRAHARKRYRPFASGELPLSLGVLMSAALMSAAFALSFWLPESFVLILSIYIASTLAYSLVLKRKIVIDIIVLGSLYALRVLGGMSALELPQAPWLLMFSLFLFLSLAIAKRCSELIATLAAEGNKLIGRGYRAEDLNVLISSGLAAGYGSVLVFALYISSPEVTGLYSHPYRLWLICPLLLYWLCRVFILCGRNELHDDPVVFALTDRNSILTGVCLLGVLAAAI